MILPSATETDPLILPSLSGFTIDRNEQVEKELEVQIEKVKQKRFRRKQFHDSQAAILGFLTPSLIASRDTPTPTDVDNAPKQETDDASPETSDPTYDPAQVLASGLTGSRELEKLHAAPESIALVVVNHNYRSLPNLPEYTAMAAWTLYSTLIDRKYGHFDHRKSRFLDNPSLVEFQDTLEFLEREAPVNSALFLYIQVCVCVFTNPKTLVVIHIHDFTIRTRDMVCVLIQVEKFPPDPTSLLPKQAFSRN